MGRKSREKHTRRLRPIPTGRPRWAGAPGFDRSWMIAERYAQAYDRLVALTKRTREAEFTDWHAERDKSELVLDVLQWQVSVARRQVATLEQAAARRGISRELDRDDTIVLPGRESDVKDRDPLPYAQSLSTLANDHLRHLAEATPIVFDPLSVPGLSMDAVEGFGLPFPVVVADFLAPRGMRLPVQVTDDGSDWWVGLTAATVAQGEEGGSIDVWPTVTTLNAQQAEQDEAPKELMFGHVRFGGPLPPAPDGLVLVEGDGWAAWTVELKDPDMWTRLWVVAPAIAAISALRVLDAVNVGLVDIALPRPARRRADREGAKPALTVDITTGRHGSASASEGHSVEWRHRWTVRGHWKHFGEGTAVARRHPSRVMDVPGHGRCVRVWCPPHVKGPADKPLVLKTRVVSNA